MALNPYLTVHASTPTAVFSGINIQITNGLGKTDSINGLGNLIIGYDEPRGMTHGGYAVCSNGEHTDPAVCRANGGTWSPNHKSGSHYLVVGPHNSYSQYGGLVAGSGNVSNGPCASVSGGANSNASGRNASVSGGLANIASGQFSAISGGVENKASGIDSSVSGGWQNLARGEKSSVTGGYRNQANGLTSAVSGGTLRQTAGTHDWRAGELFQEH
jgi:hypothetical protein